VGSWNVERGRGRGREREREERVCVGEEECVRDRERFSVSFSVRAE